MPFYYDKVLQERIWITELEKKIMDSLRFKKLNKIKQNGLAYLVYPDARNSRYDHSVGTLFWVTKLYSSIFNFEGKSIETNPDLLALRATALIHDIGHGPFSHCIEDLMVRNESWLGYEPWKGLVDKYGAHPAHELITLDYISSKEFRDCIDNDHLYEKILDLYNKKDYLSLLISGDLDADRLDYLTRDSHYSGLPFGFNTKVIFNELLDKKLELKKGRNGNPYLVLDVNGLSAFEQLLVARYAHYRYIAYERRIQVANLYFITQLETLLIKYLEDEELIAKFVYYIFKDITDDELLNLDFSKLTTDEFEPYIKSINEDNKFKELFQNMDEITHKIHNQYLKITNLGKKTAYNIMKKGRTVRLKEVEAILTGNLNQEIKLSACMPSALAMNTCIYDEDVDPKYSPSYIYDYSPLIQGLEQKMYQDIGITIISDEEIDIHKIISNFNDLVRSTEDFDYYSYGIIKYIEEVPKLFDKKQLKWELRRARIFDFIKYMHHELSQEGKINEKVSFDVAYYNIILYDILQKLEFLDVINEDYNLKHGKGSFIPSYIYSLGEYADEIKEIISLNNDEKSHVERLVTEYFYTFRALRM